MSEIVLEALAYYKDKGYTLIEVPYVVTSNISAVTKPTWCTDVVHDANKDLVYVGSGEQSFLQLLSQKRIKTGKYACLTPCVRDEHVDDTHYKVFLKLELIHVLPIGTSIHNSINNVLTDASNFFKLYLGGLIHEVATKEGYDIYFDNIELGSYGYRKAVDVEYIYGTGLALPRFNIAKKQADDYFSMMANDHLFKHDDNDNETITQLWDDIHEYKYFN